MWRTVFRFMVDQASCDIRVCERLLSPPLSFPCACAPHRAACCLSVESKYRVLLAVLEHQDTPTNEKGSNSNSLYYYYYPLLNYYYYYHPAIMPPSC